jgi:hypothetical protein
MTLFYIIQLLFYYIIYYISPLQQPGIERRLLYFAGAALSTRLSQRVRQLFNVTCFLMSLKLTSQPSKLVFKMVFWEGNDAGVQT